MALPPELIDADADKVVRRLARRGHKAYLVGGCVRDLLLNRKPKDFDVATSATPNEIKQLFRNCRIIGRRFRLAHIFFGRKIIETSTFRANPRERQATTETSEDKELLIRRDNVFGSETEDAQRRDFTINGLFYDVDTEEVIDHVGGLVDLEARLVRTIGDPDIRFQEDPVRILRAIKFAARLNFDIEKSTLAALIRCGDDITKCAAPRVLEELYRFLREGAARRSLESLIDTGVASVLSPQLTMLLHGDGSDHDAPEGAPKAQAARPLDDEEASWEATWDETPSREGGGTPISFIKDPAELARRRALAWRVIDEIDKRSSIDAGLSNALVLAAVVAPFVIDDLMQPGVRPLEASKMILEVLEPITRELSVSRRDAERTRQVLLAQRRLAPARRRRGRPMALVRRDYFDEALALYEILAVAHGRETNDIDDWRKLRSEGNRDRQHLQDEDTNPPKRRRRRRGGRRRRRTELPNDANATPSS